MEKFTVVISRVEQDGRMLSGQSRAIVNIHNSRLHLTDIPVMVSRHDQDVVILSMEGLSNSVDVKGLHTEELRRAVECGIDVIASTYAAGEIDTGSIVGVASPPQSSLTMEDMDRAIRMQDVSRQAALVNSHWNNAQMHAAQMSQNQQLNAAMNQQQHLGASRPAAAPVSTGPSNEERIDELERIVDDLTATIMELQYRLNE